MKVTDKELRWSLATNGVLHGDRQRAVYEQLLALRSERRRLRKALKEIVALRYPTFDGALGQKIDAIATSALAPTTTRRGK